MTRLFTVKTFSLIPRLQRSDWAFLRLDAKALDGQLCLNSNAQADTWRVHI